jgi:hypothetical protein
VKKLRIVLLDVTEMSGDAVCIAGIDLATGVTVRLSDRTPTRRLLRAYGGLRPADIITVQFEPKRHPILPHAEDGRWDHLTLRKDGVLNHEELHRLLAPRAFASVEEAFGALAFRGHNNNSAWLPGQGARSLATVRVAANRMYLAGDSLRVEFTDGAGVTWKGAPFQDLSVKTHPGACTSCESSFRRNVAAEFDAGDTLIRVGLTRPFAAGDTAPGCWLQVTNIFARPRRHF